MQGALPAEAQDLLHAVLEKNGQIGDQVEAILLKLWQEKPLTQEEQDLDITPAEVAGVWSITHRRPIATAAVRQAVLRRKGAWKQPIAPSKEWGQGPTLRRLYRLGDVLDVRIQEKAQTRAKN